MLPHSYQPPGPLFQPPLAPYTLKILLVDNCSFWRHERKRSLKNRQAVYFTTLFLESCILILLSWYFLLNSPQTNRIRKLHFSWSFRIKWEINIYSCTLIYWSPRQLHLLISVFSIASSLNTEDPWFHGVVHDHKSFVSITGGAIPTVYCPLYSEL